MTRLLLPLLFLLSALVSGVAWEYLVMAQQSRPAAEPTTVHDPARLAFEKQRQRKLSANKDTVFILDGVKVTGEIFMASPDAIIQRLDLDADGKTVLRVEAVTTKKGK